MATIIIGAGASGLACAIELKLNNKDADVIILERMPIIAKKILATGNGRCNFSNTNAEHHEDVVSFFNNLGLIERVDEEGRVYPFSNQATTVVETLENACKNLGIKIITECEVSKIDKNLNIETNKGNFKADHLVVATGGQAQKSLGSNGSGYSLLKSVGHNITPLNPALVQLTSPNKNVKSLKGKRVKANAKLLIDFKEVYSEFGEVLFTDYGLSGIVIMNLSNHLNNAFNENKKCHIALDLIPQMSENDILDYLNNFGSLNGILGSQLSNMFIKQTNNDFDKIANNVKNWQIIINNTKGYDFAQITSGGADTNEFNNFESKLIKNLYATGEVLNEQFECGGFNLNFAFYSGIKTAKNILGKLND